MIRRVTEPIFQPIYDFDQSLDTIRGYDHLRDDLVIVAARFPTDQPHTALLEHAELSLVTVREDELSRAQRLQKRIKTERLVSKLWVLSGLAEARTRYSQLAADELSGSKQLISKVFMEAALNGPAEDPAREGGPVQPLTEAQVILEAARKEYYELQSAVNIARRMAKEPIQVKTPPIKQLETETIDIRPATLLREFMDINKIIDDASPVMIERDLVRLMFPDLYERDRPRAYQQLEDKLSQFSEISRDSFQRIPGEIVYRGVMCKTNNAGRTLGSRGEIIYATIPSGTLINPGVSQRMNIDNQQFLITWQDKFPDWEKP